MEDDPSHEPLGLTSGVHAAIVEVDETLLLLDAPEPLVVEAEERPSLLGQLGEGGAARYVGGSEVGRGGMGVVTRAQDRDLRREVAIKQLKPGASQGVARFLREAQITAQLDHPGIVPVHDVGYSPERGFHYVMRLVRDGESLQSVVQRLSDGDEAAHATYTFERRVQIVQRVADALHFAHERGVVHRDVKPENVVVSSSGEVYLVDWGVARVVKDPPEPPTDRAGWGGVVLDPKHPQTTPGMIVGTPHYMAPEQFRGEASIRSDVYSLCALLYELLSLRHYLGEAPLTLIQLAEQIKDGDVLSADEFYDPLNGRVPRGLALICERGLAKDPAERFASVQEVERALEAWLGGRSPVVCGTTCLVRGLHAWRRAVERNPHFVMRLTVLIAGFGVLSLVLHAVELGLWLASG